MTNTATFRFYEELNDFLQPEQVKQSFPYVFNGHPAIKDAIEALGVPHTEVDLIVVNGNSVDFAYQLRPHDRVAVYPVFEGMDISPIVKLRTKPLRDTRFILDVHLGKLAGLLRMLGFDSLYRNDYSDDEIIQIALNEHRIILTRDLGILKHRTVTHGCYLHNTKPEDQLREIVHRLQLQDQSHPFTRCISCNGELKPVNKQDILDRLPPRTAQIFNTFYQCTRCDKIYWPGSHYDNMRLKLEKLLHNIHEYGDCK